MDSSTVAQRRIGVAARTKRNPHSIRVLREKERRRKKTVRHRHPALDQRRVTSRRNISARKKRPRIDRANEQDAQPRLHVAPPYVSRVTVTSERAHNHQPSTYACRTVRSCKIENTPSLVSDATLHLRSKTTAHAQCVAMRVTLTGERAHNNQPAPNTCRTARSCQIENTPSLVSDAALHLRRTTNPHNRTYPPECRHTHVRTSGLKSTNQPRISTCRTERVCHIEDTLSQTSDAALHLVHTTKPHNQTHAPERKHPQLQENKWRARPDITDSITIEQQQPQ